LAEEREGTATGLFEQDTGIPPRISVDSLNERLRSEDPLLQPIVLDVRTRSQYERDHARIPGSIRVVPDDVAAWAAEHDRERLVVAYCT
jgi:rhodanese-related sulfurtransferase